MTEERVVIDGGGAIVPPPHTLLGGLRVIEVAILAPSALGGYLAELGAEVIKIESGAGDYVRSVMRRPNQDASDMHQLWNRGKKSVVLDLDEQSGKRDFLDLVASADVVIEGRRPGYLDRKELGYQRLREVNPSIVFVCLSGFGNTGPYRDLPSHGPAFDAYAGVNPPEIDDEGRPRIPRPAHVGVGVYTGALHAGIAALAAVLHARDTGSGTYLDVAQADTAAYARATTDLAKLRGRALSSENVPFRDDELSATGAVDDLFAASCLVQYYRTTDGHILLQAMERRLFERFTVAVQRPELIKEFPTDREVDWLYGRDDVRAELSTIFASESSAYWVELAREYGFPCTPVNEAARLLDDEHFVARARWLPDHDGAPTVPGVPIHSIPGLPLVPPAPYLGEHTEEILNALRVRERSR